MKNNQLQITQKGLDALKSELNELVENKRPKVVDRLSNARLQETCRKTAITIMLRTNLNF